jgi:N-acetylneuraminic acid mutarotase
MRRTLLLCLTLAMLACTATPSAAAVGTWVREADMPVGEQAAGVAGLGGSIYVIGGFDNERIVRIYDPAANTWSQAPYALPKGRWGGAAVAAGGRILLFGGGHGDFDFLGTRSTYAVDPAAGSVTALARAPIPLEQAAAVRIPRSQKVLVVGGHDQQEAGPVLKTTPVFVYNTASDRWARRSNLPVHGSLIDGTAVSVRGHVYYYGGVVDPLSGPVSRAVFLYRVRSDSWQRVATMPAGIDVTAPGATGADGRVYIVGTDLTNARSVTIFDPATGSWSSGPAIPSTNGPRSVVAMDGTIYAMGGGYVAQGELVIAGWNWALATTP